MVAGIPQGAGHGPAVEGRYAKVTFKINDDIKVWSSGVVIKKATSLLGDNYLEIDPGEEISSSPTARKQQFTLLGRQVRDLSRLRRSARRTRAGACRTWSRRPRPIS